MKKKLYPSDIFAVIIFASMLSITFMNIVSRYLLYMGISFSEELVTRLAVLLAGLGAAQAARNESHYDIPLLDNFISRKAAFYLKAASAMLMMGFCAFLAGAGLLMVSQQYALRNISASLGIYEWIYGLTIPIGCGFMAYYSVIVLIRTIRKRGAAVQPGGKIQQGGGTP